jgi:sulfur carrier protein
MRIYVNGEETRVEAGFPLASLLQQLELNGGKIAVEINQEVIPRSTFSEHRLQPDDRVEIVRAIGGG